MEIKFIENYSFGYPKACLECLKYDNCNKEEFALSVKPSYRDTDSTMKLMLIGQDPTIRGNPDRVTHVLMLNQGGSIYRWLKDLFGDILDKIDVYATNTVKCTFTGALPTERKDVTGYQFLFNYFMQCKEHLYKEIVNFKPDYIVSFGEPAHMLLINQLFESKTIPLKMTQAFRGYFYDEFIMNEAEKISFKYSPCLHITTFRVADTYGDKVKDFKKTLLNNL